MTLPVETYTINRTADRYMSATGFEELVIGMEDIAKAETLDTTLEHLETLKSYIEWHINDLKNEVA